MVVIALLAMLDGCSSIITDDTATHNCDTSQVQYQQDDREYFACKWLGNTITINVVDLNTEPKLTP